MGQLATMARRSFLIGSAAVAGGVAFGVYKYKQPHPNPLLADLAEGASAITPYVRIDTQGVTIITPRAEMGQGIHTTLAALVAEELDVAWDSIRVAHGAPGEAYYNHTAIAEGVPFAALDHGHMAEAMRGTMGVVAKFMAMQVTGGSSSVPDAYDKMRQAGRSSRPMAGGLPTPRWQPPPPKRTCRRTCRSSPVRSGATLARRCRAWTCRASAPAPPHSASTCASPTWCLPPCA